MAASWQPAKISVDVVGYILYPGETFENVGSFPGVTDEACCRATKEFLWRGGIGCTYDNGWDLSAQLRAEKSGLTEVIFVENIMRGKTCSEWGSPLAQSKSVLVRTATVLPWVGNREGKSYYEDYMVDEVGMAYVIMRFECLHLEVVNYYRVTFWDPAE